ncbi:WD40-repeat-containing domain protein, partial [Mycena vulgaris]
MAEAPFVLTRRMSLPGAAGTNKRGSIRLFPWTVNSAGHIFNGKWRASEDWSSMVSDFSDAFLVGHGGSLYILYTSSQKAPCISLNEPGSTAEQDDDTPQVAWALRSSHPFDPLALLASYRRIFVLNVRQNKIVGYLRGHGGRITSIAVHPTSPNIFASTSSDFTTRIYDLDRHVQKNAENPVWPPWDGPSHASAAHGTDGTDSQGSGFGCCIQILVGGRSGGHVWDVLGAAFHPCLPLIATCGADRHAKIWRTLSNSTETAFLADKPLFSARITTSRVLSIAWLADDVLLMHTASTSTPVRIRPDEQEETPLSDDEQEAPPPNYIRHGTIDVFQWLGLERFFPGGKTISDPASRGGASDYQESKSYMVLSTQPLIPPQPQTQLLEAISNVSHPQMAAGPNGRFLFAYPDSKLFVILNAAKLEPKKVPSYNEETSDLVEMTKMTKRIRLDSPEPDSPQTRAAVQPSVAEDLFQLDVDTVLIVACALAPSGIMAVLGSEGTVW